MAITQKKDGRWAVVHYENGKQVWKYFGRGLDAERRAREYDKQLKQSGQVRQYRRQPPKMSPTVSELAGEYLAAKSAGMASTSARNTTYKLASIILPELGHLQAIRLTAARLDKYVTKRAHTIKLTTIHRELSDLQAILNWAVKRRLIALNPVQGYSKPKRDDAVIRPPSQAELKLLLKHSAKHLKRALLVSYFTGLRPGNAELFGLQWSAVDLQEGAIFITSARKGGPISRSVPLHPEFRQHLESWYQQDGGAGHLIKYEGQPIKSLKTAWRQAKKRAGITRRLRLYDCRHAFASAILAGGGDLKATSQLLGHSRPDTTLRVYQHTNPELLKANIGKLPKLSD